MNKLSIFLALILPFCLLPASAQQPEEPRTDDELRALIAEAGDSEKHPGADNVTVFKWTMVEVEESGLGHIHNHELIKCLTEKGAAGLARIRLDYDPASNMVEMRSVRVLRADGTVEEISSDGAVDLPQPQRAIYWGPRMRILPIPRLAVGDALEIKTYMKGFLIAYLGDVASGGGGSSDEDGDERYIPPMRGHFYDVVYFQESRPVMLRHYTVRTPRDKPVQFEVYNGEVQSYVTFDDEYLSYSFWKRDLKPFHGEPRSAALSDITTKVVLATVQDWRDKSQWFAQVNADQFNPNDGIRAKVEELTAGKRTDDEKIAAIVHWVANNIRYSGVSMGKGEGYTLHPADMIWRNKSGVCKDKAAMGVTMLRAAGFDVWPAMTMAGSRVERIPADQFNHCITAIRTGAGEFRMVDPTWVPLSMETWSTAEGEQHYLVGTPEGELLTTTPTFEPSKNKLNISSRAVLHSDGSLTGDLVIQGEEYADQRIRRQLAQSTAATDRQAWFESLVGRIGPGASVDKVEVRYGDPMDLSEPLRVEISYHIPRFALATGDKIHFSPPMSRHLIVPAYLEAAGLDEREQPLFLWSPRFRNVTETIRLPKGFQVTRLPEDRDIDGDAASLRTHTEVDGNTLTYTYRLKIKKRTIPPEEYANLRDVIREAIDLPGDMLLLEKR